jgi:hypothetical protein
VRRPRQLDESQCYARCYGALDGNVRIIRIRPRVPMRDEPHVSGEDLRRSFELRLDAREPEAA